MVCSRTEFSPGSHDPGRTHILAQYVIYLLSITHLCIMIYLYITVCLYNITHVYNVIYMYSVACRVLHGMPRPASIQAAQRGDGGHILNVRVGEARPGQTFSRVAV